MAVWYKRGKTQQLLRTSDGVPQLSQSDTEGLEDSWRASGSCWKVRKAGFLSTKEMIPAMAAIWQKP